MNRIKDALGVFTSLLRSGGSSDSAASLVSAAKNAGSALDALQLLKQQEQLLMKQLLAISAGKQHGAAAHAHVAPGQEGSGSQPHSDPHQTPLASKSRPQTDLMSVISALKTLCEAVPAHTLNRLTRFAVEQGASHVTRGLSRSYAGPVGGSSTMAQENDPFGLLMALTPDHPMRPMTWHQYLSTCQTVDRAGGQTVLSPTGLRLLQRYIKARRLLARTWASWPPPGTAVDAEVVNQVQAHVRRLSMNVAADESQLKALAAWHSSHTHAMRRDTGGVDFYLIEMQLKNKLMQQWAPGNKVFDAYQKALPLWTKLTRAIKQSDRKEELEFEEIHGLVSEGEGHGQQDEGSTSCASSQGGDDLGSSALWLTHLTENEWNSLESSLRTITLTLHPTRSIKFRVDAQLAEFEEVMERNTRQGKH